MWKRQNCGTAIAVWMALLFLCFSPAISFADEPGTRDQLLLLQKQNEQLQKQLQRQQELIDELNRKVSAIQENTSRQAQEPAEKAGPQQPEENPPALSQAFHLGKVDLSGEGG